MFTHHNCIFVLYLFQSSWLDANLKKMGKYLSRLSDICPKWFYDMWSPDVTVLSVPIWTSRPRWPLYHHQWRAFNRSRQRFMYTAYITLLLTVYHHWWFISYTSKIFLDYYISWLLKIPVAAVSYTVRLDSFFKNSIFFVTVTIL